MPKPATWAGFALVRFLKQLSEKKITMNIGGWGGDKLKRFSDYDEDMNAKDLQLEILDI